MNRIKTQNILPPPIKNLNEMSSDISDLVSFLKKEIKIDISSDRDFVQSYERDWSNMPGYADAVARPINSVECAILLYLFSKSDIPITISAGKTNLTGSATPESGLLISTELMTSPKSKINIESKTVKVPIGEILENVRERILSETNNKLYYPVDPTSRKDARVGGTISCNASGFIPGEKGATRYWVESLSVLLVNGQLIKAKRGEYVSEKGRFFIDGKEIILPNYNRPNIKNASGPYTVDVTEMDFVDLIVGSEGIFGMIVDCELRLDDLSKNHLDLFIPFESESKAIDFYYYINSLMKDKNFDIKAFEYFGYNCQDYMNNREYLFEDKNKVGIYMQVPIFDKNIENIAKDWMNLLENSNCNIDSSKVLLLNESENVI